jgi:hypothetical protein
MNVRTAEQASLHGCLWLTLMITDYLRDISEQKAVVPFPAHHGIQPVGKRRKVPPWTKIQYRLVIASISIHLVYGNHHSG